MNRTVKRIFRFVGYGLLAIVFLFLIAIGWLYLYSSGTTAPIVDAQGRPVAGSIASLECIELNGVKQWILIRGYDRTKPILLFVHGGPGSPEMPLLTNNEALEKRFVVVNWDQRGSGKSYDPAVFNNSFTLGTFIEDAAQLSRLLAQRFNQPKIYLMGHSWG
ncbi:MAG TPA: alpha/beta fold hydrolase, partial [Fibrella sp.]